MMYNDYLNKISTVAGYKPNYEKINEVSSMFSDDYIRRGLAMQYLSEGIIDKNMANYLITKALINNYI